MIRILIADDENLIRAALTQLLELEDDITVVAQAGTGRAALDEARALAVTGTLDVAVLDLQMPEPDGISVAPELVLLDVHSIIVTSHGRPGHLKRALAAGVRGFLPKTTEAARLAEVIRLVAGGGRYVDPQLAARRSVPETHRSPPAKRTAWNSRQTEPGSRTSPHGYTSRPEPYATTCQAPSPSWAQQTGTTRAPRPSAWAGSEGP
jgi:DNA-binding NarL/FixJ family response regulator